MDRIAHAWLVEGLQPVQIATSDALRADVSKLYSLSVALYYGNLRHLIQDRVKVKLVDTDALTEAANECGYRIRLRLDPTKPHASDLIKSMDDLVHLASHATELFDTTNRAVELVLEKTQDAWKQVRRGEPRFRWSFRIAFTVLILSLLWALTTWLAQHGHSLLVLFLGNELPASSLMNAEIRKTIIFCLDAHHIRKLVGSRRMKLVESGS